MAGIWERVGGLYLLNRAEAKVEAPRTPSAEKEGRDEPIVEVRCEDAQGHQTQHRRSRRVSIAERPVSMGWYGDVSLRIQNSGSGRGRCDLLSPLSAEARQQNDIQKWPHDFLVAHLLSNHLVRGRECGER